MNNPSPSIVFGLTLEPLIPNSPPTRSLIIWDNRGLGVLSYGNDKLFHLTAHLITRFVSDVESDSPHTADLRSRLCTKILEDFFDANMECVIDQAWDSWVDRLITNANLIACWANLGFLEESAIHDHILQSLISEPLSKLYDHQADTMIILFKIAGAAFEAYADPSVVDRCFELLKDHYGHNTTKGRLVQVRMQPHTLQGGHRADETFQEVVDLRERSWEGLPPRLCSRRRSSKLSEQTRETWLLLLSLPLLDFLTEILNFGFLRLLDSKSPSQKQMRHLYLPSLSLRPSVSPLCPTLQLQMSRMTRLPSTPRP